MAETHDKSSSSSCSSSSSKGLDALFDHERLHVYQASLDFVEYVFGLASDKEGIHRHARDQIVRSSMSIPLNIAEGNGKRSTNDRNRFFEIARGSAMESAAALDVLVRTGACELETVEEGKLLLNRIVSMLYKMTRARDAARERPSKYEVEAGFSDDDDEHDDENCEGRVLRED